MPRAVGQGFRLERMAKLILQKKTSSKGPNQPINRPANGRFAMLEIMKAKPPSILQRRVTVYDYE
jgi:hypothetical protein